jgi:hypothetical protein
MCDVEMEIIVDHVWRSETLDGLLGLQSPTQIIVGKIGLPN